MQHDAVGELGFSPLSITYHPFESFYDYQGGYGRLSADGQQLSFVFDETMPVGNFDLDGSYELVSEGGEPLRLILHDMWLADVTPSACALIFEPIYYEQ